MTTPRPAPASADAPVIDLAALFETAGRIGHTGWLGIRYRAHGPDWAELELPFDAKLIGDEARGVVATGAIVTLMDNATSAAALLRAARLAPQATLDLRLDYLRPAAPGRTIVGRGECYRLTRRIAFVRGIAHDGDPADPVAHAAGTFMFTDVA